MKSGGRTTPEYARQAMAEVFACLYGEGFRVLKVKHVGVIDGFENVLVEAEVKPEDFE